MTGRADTGLLEARVAAAFTRAATEIEVAPRPFEAGDAPEPVGRGVRLASPKPPGADRPTSELDARPPTDGSRRGPRLMAAAAALIALAMGAAAFRHARSSDAGAGSGSERSSLRTVERTGTIDPMLVDYVFPVNGDAWVAAKVRYEVAAARAKAPSIATCVRERGFPGAESLVVEEARLVERVLMMNLPSLAVIARHRLEPIVSPPDSPERAAAFECKGIDRSEPSEWEDETERLTSVEHVRPAFATVESTPVWTDARSCMTSAGAPPDAPEAMRADMQRAADEAGEELPADPPPGFEAYFGWIGGDAQAEAFVRCMTPFFAEVERVLQGPRADFVAEHRDELLELQRRFEAFAGPGD